MPQVGPRPPAASAENLSCSGHLHLWLKSNFVLDPPLKAKPSDKSLWNKHCLNRKIDSVYMMLTINKLSPLKQMVSSRKKVVCLPYKKNLPLPEEKKIFWLRQRRIFFWPGQKRIPPLRISAPKWCKRQNGSYCCRSWISRRNKWVSQRYELKQKKWFNHISWILCHFYDAVAMRISDVVTEWNLLMCPPNVICFYFIFRLRCPKLLLRNVICRCESS